VGHGESVNLHALTGIYVERHTRHVDTFVALAEPTRRRILDELRDAESTVNELVERLAVSQPAVSQPAVSKHLKVLRESGFVSCRTAAQRRIYRVEAPAFEALARWLEPYRQLWTHHLDALERHLDNQEEQ
jgi:DNA-binding transcriptional ArsR family regulator